MKLHRALVIPGFIVAAAALGACQQSAFDIEVGDCYGATGEQVSTVNAVDCSEPHVYEAYAVFDYPAEGDADFPGESAIGTHAEEECVAAFEPYVGTSYEESELYFSTLTPTEESWEGGDREIICSLNLQDESELTGSQRNSNR